MKSTVYSFMTHQPIPRLIKASVERQNPDIFMKLKTTLLFRKYLYEKRLGYGLEEMELSD